MTFCSLNCDATLFLWWETMQFSIGKKISKSFHRDHFKNNSALILLGLDNAHYVYLAFEVIDDT